MGNTQRLAWPDRPSGRAVFVFWSTNGKPPTPGESGAAPIARQRIAAANARRVGRVFSRGAIGRRARVPGVGGFSFLQIGPAAGLKLPLGKAQDEAHHWIL